MKNKKGLPVCGKTIDGPKVGYRVVLWRKQCGRRVKQEGDRCYQHQPAESFRPWRRGFDADLVDADCIHGEPWQECPDCAKGYPPAPVEPAKP